MNNWIRFGLTFVLSGLIVAIGMGGYTAVTIGFRSSEFGWSIGGSVILLITGCILLWINYLQEKSMKRVMSGEWVISSGFKKSHISAQ